MVILDADIAEMLRGLEVEDAAAVVGPMAAQQGLAAPWRPRCATPAGGSVSDTANDPVRWRIGIANTASYE